MVPFRFLIVTLFFVFDGFHSPLSVNVLMIVMPLMVFMGLLTVCIVLKVFILSMEWLCCFSFCQSDCGFDNC